MYRPYEQCETPNIPCSKPIVPAPSDSATMNLLIEHVEPLLKNYSVDIGFYGHSHAVQRDASVYNRTGELCNHSYIRYLQFKLIVTFS